MEKKEYKIVVGLEIHVHLAARTKLFCGCELAYGQPPNTRVCPGCLGMPGVLPMMNKTAIEYAILTALALHCKIPPFTKWDRKSYFYPDLPRNYQVSQFEPPVGMEGFIEIPSNDGGTKKVRIRRVHLEEDAGKNVHTLGNFSGVDFNRAGAPLLEIVTEPDMNSPADVRALALELQRIVRYLGVSEGDMQKGHMRFEPNINLHIERGGQVFKTPISEVKNLNSFRSLERSVSYEAARQYEEFLETGKTQQVGNKRTFGWDDVREATVLQREKEEAHDYRYFPDPDLAPVKVSEQWLQQIRRRLCELPLAMQNRFVSQYGLSVYDAGVLTGDRTTAEFFDRAVKLGADPKRVCNLLTQVGLKIANETAVRIDELKITPENLAQLARMADAGTISATAANTLFEYLARHGGDPDSAAREQNLIQSSDSGEIEALVDTVIAEQPQAVQDVVQGTKKAGKAQGFLTGQVIQKSGGQANPKIVAQILSKKLAALKEGG